MRPILLRSSLLLVACAPLALGHPGHGPTSFQAGATHPLSGLDHLLAMIAVGMLAARLGGNALWQLPVTFLLAMLGGGLLALAGLPLPGVEWGVAGSVLVLGLVLAVAIPPRKPLALIAIALFAALHGHAHAAERASEHGFAAYAAGFLLATACLHALGVGLGVWAIRTRSEALVRVGGGVMAAASLAIIASLLA